MGTPYRSSVSAASSTNPGSVNSRYRAQNRVLSSLATNSARIGATAQVSARTAAGLRDTDSMPSPMMTPPTTPAAKIVSGTAKSVRQSAGVSQEICALCRCPSQASGSSGSTPTAAATAQVTSRARSRRSSTTIPCATSSSTATRCAAPSSATEPA